MAKQVYQYRFCTDNANCAELISDNQELTLPDGTILSGVEQISIETIPGVMFFINGIVGRVGLTGIYEVNFKEKTINSLYFDKNSIELIKKRHERDMDKNNRNTKTMLIINVVYDK